MHLAHVAPKSPAHRRDTLETRVTSASPPASRDDGTPSRPFSGRELVPDGDDQLLSPPHQASDSRTHTMLLARTRHNTT